MLFYNYIFYKGCQIARKSRNYRSTPAIFASGLMWFCLFFHLTSIAFILDGAGVVSFKPFFSGVIAKVVAMALFIAVDIYYTYKKRYIRIIDHWKLNEPQFLRKIHPAVTYFAIFLISMFIWYMSAFYKNKDWIFAE